ncbi:MAG: hypothetical protein AAGE61_17140, partial [Pseudomonadota bacterium]
GSGAVMSTVLFQETIRALWDSIDLGIPEFTQDGRVDLEIDDIDVTLRDADDDTRMIAEATGGFLTENPSSRRDQLEKILRLNLAVTPSHAVLVTSETNRTGMDEIRIRAYYTYSANDVGHLADLISDVVSAAQTYRTVTAGERTAPRAIQDTDFGHGADETEDIVIFQP